MSVCLDAYALLAWLQDEPGADVVEKYLERAASDGGFTCYISIINLGEVYYRLYRARGPEEAESFWDAVRRGIVPVEPVEPTRNRIRQAAQMKGRFPVAYADAFAAQVAREKHVSLVTGDIELGALEEAGLISVIWLEKAS